MDVGDILAFFLFLLSVRGLDGRGQRGCPLEHVKLRIDLRRRAASRSRVSTRSD